MTGETVTWDAAPSWRQRVKRLARGIGLEVARWRPPERRLGDFLSGQSIATVLDVGASGGQFGLELRAAGFAGRIISFEPLTEPFRALEATASADAQWEVHRLALGDDPGQRAINVARNTTSSSFLELHEQHAGAAPEARLVGSEQVDVRRLDDLAPTLRLRGPVLLKLDVQGFQLSVLRGAEATLPSVAAVQCELSVSPLYAGEPALLDALGALREFGFELADLEPGFYDRASGRVLQFDGRFVRA